ncbi:electron transport complex subunit RsxC [Elusimicrobiota bacterium]
MYGGIKTRTYKERTRFEKIENLPLPDEVTLYTSQHIGAPSEVIVKKKEHIQKGQLIAQAYGSCSSNLHASVSGKVRDIAKIEANCGVISEAITIIREGEQDMQLMDTLKDPAPDLIRQRVRDAGIVGMGGAGFPTHVKLDPPKKIDIAFLNGCECEPYLTSDERVIIEENSKVLKGFLLVIKAIGADKGIIGIEDDKPDAIKRMKMAASTCKKVEIAIVPKKYPQGYEKMLITEVTGREVPSKGLPHDAGVSVHNASTCLAVYEAVYEGKPLVERVLTLTGPKVIGPVNVRAPIGMKIKEILQYYQIEGSPSHEIFAGGPMMGVSIDSVELAVLKTTSGIMIDRERIYREYPCVRCGKCVEACPMGIVPQALNMYADGKDWKKMEEENLSDCMECGCCTYVCPSKIHLTYKFKTAKVLI